MDKLYENIAKRRKELGISMAELARRTGYSRSMILYIERGKVDLAIDKVELIAKALLTTPRELLGWEEEKPDLKEEIYKNVDALTDRQLALLLAFVKSMKEEKEE